MSWNIILVDEVEAWFIDMVKAEDEAAAAVTAAIDLLEEHGPNLGRPIADRLKGSKLHNLKELRPSGTSIRILFIFDPERNAVLLVAGDKAGNWKRWYETNMSIAENRYNAWLAGHYDEEVQ